MSLDERLARFRNDPHGQCECGATGDFMYVCPTCEAKWDAEEAERKARQDAKAFEARTATLPSRLRNVVLDDLDQEGNWDAFGAARRWGAGDLQGLLLTGSFGTGKTTIAAGAMRLLMARRNGTWVSAPELLLRLSTGFDDDQRRTATAALLDSTALVFDDVDKIRPTAYGAEQMFVAIDNCIQRERPLLVTTNLDLAQLANRYPDGFGEAIASRLAGYCETHLVTGPDRRLIK